MVFETVHTGGRTIRDCLTSLDRATRNLGMADNNQNEKDILKYYDAMSTWSHTLGAAILNIWLVRVEKIRKNFKVRAKQVGAAQAAQEVESYIEYYRKLCEEFSKSEKTSKYAALHLQHAGNSMKRKLRKSKKHFGKEKRSVVAQESAAASKVDKFSVHKRKEEMKARIEAMRQENLRKKQRTA